MISELPDMPDGVIGFQASGEVSADDYKNVLVPAIDRAVESGGKVRLVYELGEDYGGFEAGGVWQDLRVGTSHFYSFGRVALVTDVDWMRRATKAFGFLMPGEIKVFGLDERADAARWAAGD